MSKKDVYKTVKKQSQSLLIEKKSKFIANVKPVDNEDDALAFLNEMRSKYSDATHNVYAYVIDENNIFRYSDDGEPSGTAGMPVLDAIRTLLGTGGLVHTYGASAKQGLIESEIVIRKLCDIVSVKVDYSLLGKMQHEIMTKGYLLEDTIYEDEVTFIISCPIDTTDKVIAEIINMTNAGVVCEKIDKKYVDVKEEEG